MSTYKNGLVLGVGLGYNIVTSKLIFKFKMAARIDLIYTIADTRGKVKQRYFESLGLRGQIGQVTLVDSYTVDAGLNRKHLQMAAEALRNPLMEKAGINEPLSPKKFDWAVEIGFLPGVTDNTGKTAMEIIADRIKRKFKPGEGIYSSQVFFISGRLQKADIKKISESLHNPLIQRAKVKSYPQFKKDGGMGTEAPRVKLLASSKVVKVDLAASDKELLVLDKEGIMDLKGFRRGPLALGLKNLKAIREHFKKLGRKPFDVELEALAQTWSEHCKHTIFQSPMDGLKQGLYQTYIKGATEKIRAQKGKEDFCVSVFTDNSGAIKFDDNHLLTYKVETHNTPSALDPFGGALTGIVGVNRDTLGFGLGAKPVANVYGFCLAHPQNQAKLFRDKELKQPLLPARRIMEGVVAGVNVGGNCSGIPTPLGFVYFDRRFQGKPLVFAGTVGLIPAQILGQPSHQKQAKPGDYIVMLGGRVGADGIHGATFSSVALDSHSPAAAVQIGDPITQKKFSDALVREARNQGFYTSITDNGAGGLSSSVSEMAKEAGGFEVNLKKVPLKYPGLQPWQIWISESQERMTLAVPKTKWPKFAKLMQSRDVECSIIGQFTNSGRAVVQYGSQKVLDLDLEFLHNGWVKEKLRSKSFKVKTSEPKIAQPKNLNQVLLKLLGQPNLASFAFISQQYDHEVQGGSVIKPLQGAGLVNGNAVIFRPVLASKKAAVLSLGLYPAYSDFDTYQMAACAVDTAVRNSIACGGRLSHLAILDNFCWCSAVEPNRLWQLKRAAKACFDYAVAFGTPFISGKDSMFNDFAGFDDTGKAIKISIPPTLLISALGVVEDITKAVSEDFKFAGDLIYVLGETLEELSASEYCRMSAKESSREISAGRVPTVDAKKNLKLYAAMEAAIQKGLLASSLSLGRGGLGYGICKSAMAGSLGAEISLKGLPGKVSRNDFALFAESPGRLLVSVAPAKQAAFEREFQGLNFKLLGRVSKRPVLKISGLTGESAIHLPLASALKAYRATFKSY